MRVPTRIPLVGRLITVNYVKRLVSEEEEIFALTYVEDMRIEISTSRPDSEQAVWDTLVHELCHMVLGRAGLSEILGVSLEEALCYSLEALGPILRIPEGVSSSRWADVPFSFEEA